MNVTRKQDYIDLDLDFGIHPGTGDISRKYGEEAIKRSIRNLVLTNFYDRPFQPSIGSSVQQLLFEPISASTAIFIKQSIVEVISNFEPRATLIDVIVDVSADINSYDAKIIFVTNNAKEPIVSQLFLERIR